MIKPITTPDDLASLLRGNGISLAALISVFDYAEKALEERRDNQAVDDMHGNVFLIRQGLLSLYAQLPREEYADATG